MVYVFALIASFFFALSTVLQHIEAKAQPLQKKPSLALVGKLVRRWVWWGGIAVGAIGYGAEAAALGVGSVIAVQALKTSTLLFLLPMAALAGSSRPGLRRWLQALGLCGALSGFLLVGNPQEGRAQAEIFDWIWSWGAVAAVVVAAVTLTYHAPPWRRALGHGVAAGAGWALTTIMTKSTLDVVATQHWGVFLHWQIWGLAIAGITSTVMNQSAFQGEEITWSLPAMAVVEPMIGMVLGVGLFEEKLARDDPFGIALLVASGLVMLFFAGALARPLPTYRRAT